MASFWSLMKESWNPGGSGTRLKLRGRPNSAASPAFDVERGHDHRIGPQPLPARAFVRADEQNREPVPRHTLFVREEWRLRHRRGHDVDPHVNRFRIADARTEHEVACRPAGFEDHRFGRFRSLLGWLGLPNHLDGQDLLDRFFLGHEHRLEQRDAADRVRRGGDLGRRHHDDQDGEQRRGETGRRTAPSRDHVCVDDGDSAPPEHSDVRCERHPQQRRLDDPAEERTEPE